MGQIRAHLNDLGGLTEWMFRKVRNHDPMSQRDVQVTREKFKASHLNARGAPVMRQDRARVEYSLASNQVVYNLGNGKRYLLTVHEVDEDFELEAPLKVPA